MERSLLRGDFARSIVACALIKLSRVAPVPSLIQNRISFPSGDQAGCQPIFPRNRTTKDFASPLASTIASSV